MQTVVLYAAFFSGAAIVIFLFFKPLCCRDRSARIFSVSTAAVLALIAIFSEFVVSQLFQEANTVGNGFTFSQSTAIPLGIAFGLLLSAAFGSFGKNR